MSEESYQAGLRAAVRGLWSGAFGNDGYDTFWSMFSAAIRTGLTQAWYEGLKAGGIQPEEQTEEEKAELLNIIVNQYGYIGRLANDIIIGTRNPETGQMYSGKKRVKLGVFYSRIEMWVKAWKVTYNKAEAMANSNKKKEFVYGKTKEHCQTCSALVGKVKRYSYIVAHGLLNKPDDRFDCKRYRCDCDWIDTDKPLSKGPLPKGL